MVYLALELVGPWVVLGFSVGMVALVSSCQLMFPGIRSSLVFSGFGLKPSASGFQSYSYSSPRLLHPYSTDDKTSMFMVNRFSTVRDTQRGSQSYMEKRRDPLEFFLNFILFLNFT